MGGDKDDWDGASLRLQMILKLEAIHPWQVDVQDEARGIVDTLGSQELLGRPVSVHSESNRSHKTLECLAYRRIVIHDRNVAGWALLCHCSRHFHRRQSSSRFYRKRSTCRRPSCFGNRRLLL